MFTIIGIIAVIRAAYAFCNTVETMAKNYEKKINDGWIDYRSNNAFRA